MKLLQALLSVAIFFLLAQVSYAAVNQEEDERVAFSGSVGAPDPNTNPCRLVDDFFYQPVGDSPLNSILGGRGPLSSTTRFATFQPIYQISRFRVGPLTDT